MKGNQEPNVSGSSGSFFDKIQKLELWHRIAIGVALILMPCAILTWLEFYPNYEEICKLEENLQGLEKQLATSKLNAAELEKFQVKFREAEKDFRVAMRALPERSEIPKLLSGVSTSSRDIGVELLSFVPSPTEVKKEFYAELPMEIKIRGRYHDLMTFFDRVARLSRIINIEKMTINQDKQRQNVNDPSVLEAKVTAVTYKFIEPPVEKPAPATKPKSAPAQPAPQNKPKSGNLKGLD
jgi:type IV pilus assembly protein PilO